MGFLKAGSSHGELEKICKNLASVPTKDKSVVKDEDFLDPTKFLPGNKTFFTYPGSLTTPPLYESVTWILFKQPVEISSVQLKIMRDMKFGDSNSENMRDNYRPVCPRHSRVIRQPKFL